MPIVDVHIVVRESERLPPDLAQSLANALGAAFEAEPGRVWVRLHPLERHHYAENDAVLADDELPVFVRVLHARLPEPSARAVQASVLAKRVGECVGRPPDRIHVEFAPEGAGRIAFGGRLVPPPA